MITEKGYSIAEVARNPGINANMLEGLFLSASLLVQSLPEFLNQL